jgi:hypothetical protein
MMYKEKLAVCSEIRIKQRKASTMYTYFLNHSIQQSPSWEANRFAASQEVPLSLWNPKVHYRIQSARHLYLS